MDAGFLRLVTFPWRDAVFRRAVEELYTDYLPRHPQELEQILRVQYYAVRVVPVVGSDDGDGPETWWVHRDGDDAR